MPPARRGIAPDKSFVLRSDVRPGGRTSAFTIARSGLVVMAETRMSTQLVQLVPNATQHANSPDGYGRSVSQSNEPVLNIATNVSYGCGREKAAYPKICGTVLSPGPL